MQINPLTTIIVNKQNKHQITRGFTCEFTFNSISHFDSDRTELFWCLEQIEAFSFKLEVLAIKKNIENVVNENSHLSI